VADRKKWKDIFRQAKAHSALYYKWKKMMKKKKKKKKKVAEPEHALLLSFKGKK